jgi:hypothetical protein
VKTIDLKNSLFTDAATACGAEQTLVK